LCTFIWFRGGHSDLDKIAFANQSSDIVLESELVDVGGTTLHVVFAGPRDGEPVVLLHGFPGFWYIWHEHIERLANIGKARENSKRYYSFHITTGQSL